MATTLPLHTKHRASPRLGGSKSNFRSPKSIQPLLTSNGNDEVVANRDSSRVPEAASASPGFASRSWPVDTDKLGASLASTSSKTFPFSTSHNKTPPKKSVDRRSFPSGENATDLAQPEWPSRVLRQVPVAGSHSLTVLSPDPDARSFPSGENLTSLTILVCALSTCKVESQSSETGGVASIQSGSWCQKRSLTVLRLGLNMSAEEYTWRGAISMAILNVRTNRTASLAIARKPGLALDFTSMSV